MITFRCPACGKEAVVPDDKAGRKVTCSCGNVNIVPPPAPTGAQTQPQKPEIIYQGRPSQLENLWAFLGLVVVTVAALWPLRSALSRVFKTSNWDWFSALILIALYLLWLGYRILKLKRISYTVTTDKILLEQGILFRKLDSIELPRVTDLKVKRSILQRLLGTGRIWISSSDPSLPEVALRGIPEPRRVFEAIRKTWRSGQSGRT